jgi:hypothetical protein
VGVFPHPNSHLLSLDLGWFVYSGTLAVCFRHSAGITRIIS